MKQPSLHGKAASGKLYSSFSARIGCSKGPGQSEGPCLPNVPWQPEGPGRPESPGRSRRSETPSLAGTKTSPKFHTRLFPKVLLFYWSMAIRRSRANGKPWSLPQGRTPLPYKPHSNYGLLIKRSMAIRRSMATRRSRAIAKPWSLPQERIPLLTKTSPKLYTRLLKTPPKIQTRHPY